MPKDDRPLIYYDVYALVPKAEGPFPASGVFIGKDPDAICPDVFREMMDRHTGDLRYGRFRITSMRPMAAGKERE